MLLEHIVFVVKIVRISGRTTGVVRLHISCYAPTIIQAYNTPSFLFTQQLFICLSVICYSNDSFFRRERNCSASLFLIESLMLQVLSKV